ncbi:MAG: hypothetical protein H6R10_3702 [Rhodocyclaceae bacterium]|nr:hypothetical protein [Rhodocyclaceae bacterium]
MNSCLTLILPRSLEEQVIDILLQHPDWIGPFTTHPADGHGAPGAMTSPAEQVRGRTERVRIEILIHDNHAREMISVLHDEFRGAQVFWWLTPVIDAGSFA